VTGSYIIERIDAENDTDFIDNIRETTKNIIEISPAFDKLHDYLRAESEKIDGDDAFSEEESDKKLGVSQNKSSPILSEAFMPALHENLIEMIDEALLYLGRMKDKTVLESFLSMIHDLIEKISKIFQNEKKQAETQNERDNLRGDTGIRVNNGSGRGK